MRFAVSGPRGELAVEKEMIRVGYESDLDAGWLFTDVAGHVHYCDYAAAEHYPTLLLVTDGSYYCPDCRDEHEDSHLECRRCGERIIPGRTGPGTITLGGQAVYTFNGEPVSQEHALRILAEMRVPGG